MGQKYPPRKSRSSLSQKSLDSFPPCMTYRTLQQALKSRCPKCSYGTRATSKKWATLGMKQGATELALDGRLLDHNEQEIDKSAIVRELIERGLRITSEAVDETSVFEAWEEIPQIEQYVANNIASAADLALARAQA